MVLEEVEVVVVIENQCKIMDSKSISNNRWSFTSYSNLLSNNSRSWWIKRFTYSRW
jgi:hypothetical protein